MKTLKIVFALVSIFFIFPSCSNDDDAADDNSEVISQLLGRWVYDGMTVDGGAFEENPSEEVDVIYEFRTGGILLVTIRDYEFDEDDQFSGTYTVNNNSLTTRIDGDVVTYTITQLNATSLRLAARLDVDDDPGLEDAVFYFSKM